jgi:aromatase
VITHDSRHEVLVAAEAEDVYALLADATRWPHLFRRVVHVDVLQDDGSEQLLQAWTLAREEVRDCMVRRRLDASAGGISYEVIVTRPPVASMAVQWVVENAGGHKCRVVLIHRFEALGDDADAAAWINRAVDQCSTTDLAAVKRAAETNAGNAGVYLTFCDAEVIHGTAASVFDFVSDVGAWPEKVPHVGRLALTERAGGVQHTETSMFGPDGSVHTTEAVRLCFPERGAIFYKQLRTPVLMSAHTGHWEFGESGGAVIARSWHTVTLDPEGVRAVLGPDMSTVQLRAKVRHALGTDSLMTLRRAKEYIEGGRGV